MMKKQRVLTMVGVCLTVAVVAAPLSWSKSGRKSANTADAVRAEIAAMAGKVPAFLQRVPDDVIGPVWEEMKQFGFAETAIPSKYKELIGLAVAAQIPCSYCTYAHDKFARMHGANDDEVVEATLMAATVRRWSTFLNGLAFDEAAFAKDIDRMLAHAMKAPPPKAKGAPARIETAQDALRDVERTFGFVPAFIARYPKQGLAPAWNQYKAIELDPNGALPPKYRELIGLAVAAQIPCRYCVVAHTKVARAFGASDDELAEAVAIAGMTRQWSTFLNGVQIDEAQHRREVDGLIEHTRRAASSR